MKLNPFNHEKKFYNDLDEVFTVFIETINKYNRSIILQNYFFEFFESLFYAKIINNFFLNLSPENPEKSELSIEIFEAVRNEYDDVQKDVNTVIHIQNDERKKIDEIYYNEFKARLKCDFPQLFNLISQLEKEIDIKWGKQYLKYKKDEIKKSGRSDGDLDSKIRTKIIEVNIKKKNSFPSGKDLDKLKDGISNKLIPDIAQLFFKALKTNSKKMLTEQRDYKTECVAVLYERWKEPLDLLECLIRVSLESIDEHRIKTAKKGILNDIKFEAIIKIHARAVQISNEILILLNAGYADGANARWRSLHELAVISIFLLKNDEEVSRRYLEHETVMRLKNAKDYQKFCDKIGYEPLEKEFYDKLKEKENRLCCKYDEEDSKYDEKIKKNGKKNYRRDWGWIPSSILKNKNFRGLEEHIKLDKWHPYYNFSSATIHGGSRGLYRLGLSNDLQNKVLMVGASNYGLADPLQNTAISLSQISTCILSIRSDFESLIQIKIMHEFVKEIGYKAVKIQKEIEKEIKK